MKQFCKLTLLTLGFGVLAVLLGLLTDNRANAAPPVISAPVTVVNTAANPVPTLAEGTTKVAGTVSVNFPATQNVSFNGTAQPVSVSNTNTTPLFILDVDEAANHPFAAQSVCLSGLSCPSITAPSTLADGTPVKRLVIEYVSGEGVSTAGQTVISVSLQYNLGGDVGVAQFVPVHTGTTSNSLTLTEFGSATKLYVDPGAPIFSTLTATDDGTSFSVSRVCVSGYLVTQ